jgi:hypothetical protein
MFCSTLSSTRAQLKHVNNSKVATLANSATVWILMYNLKQFLIYWQLRLVLQIDI